MDRDETARSTPIDEELASSFDLAEMSGAEVTAEIVRRLESWKRLNLPPAGEQFAEAPQAPLAMEPAPPEAGDAPDDALIYSDDFAALLTASPAPRPTLGGVSRRWRIGGRLARSGAALRRAWLDLAHTVAPRVARRIARGGATAIGIAAGIAAASRTVLRGTAIRVLRLGGTAGGGIARALSRLSVAARANAVAAARGGKAAWHGFIGSGIWPGLARRIARGGAVTGGVAARVATRSWIFLRWAIMGAARHCWAIGSDIAFGLRHLLALLRVGAIAAARNGRAALRGVIASRPWRAVPAGPMPARVALAGAAIFALIVGGWALMPRERAMPAQDLALDLANSGTPAQQIASTIAGTERPRAIAPLRPPPAEPAGQSVQAASAPAPAASPLAPELPRPMLVAWLKPTTRPAKPPAILPVLVARTDPANTAPAPQAPASPSTDLVAAPEEATDPIAAAIASEGAKVERQNAAVESNATGDGATVKEAAPNEPASNQDVGNGNADNEDDGWMFDSMFSDGLTHRLP